MVTSEPRWFALHGLAIAVEASTRPLAQRAADVLEHFGATAGPPAPDADLRLILRAGEGSAPVSLAGRQTARHLDVRTLRDADGLVLEASGAVARLTADGRLGEVWLGAGAQIPLHVFTCVFVNQLRLLGWYVLHAGCVAWDGAGCLVIGESGAGKSTLVLSLLQQGWQLLSDDSVLLRGADVFALRRGIYLEPRRAAEAFPALVGRWRPCPLVEATKQQLAVEALFPDAQRARCAPALALLPAVEDRAETELEPIGPAELLYELVRQSRLSELDTDGAAAHLALLGEIASRVPACRARLGRDVIERPAAVSARLREQTRGGLR